MEDNWFVEINIRKTLFFCFPLIIRNTGLTFCHVIDPKKVGQNIKEKSVMHFLIMERQLACFTYVIFKCKKTIFSCGTNSTNTAAYLSLFFPKVLMKPLLRQGWCQVLVMWSKNSCTFLQLEYGVSCSRNFFF